MKNTLVSAFRQVGFLPADFCAAFRNDPALRGKVFGILELLTYPGVWAILFHRIVHLLFALKIPFFPRLISQTSRLLTGIEIHPGAKIGSGFFIDHGMGVVIGETAEIGKNVLMYHGVTLGGTSLNAGKRHPTVGENVLIGAGAKILGPVVVGNCAQIGAGAVVLKNIPAYGVVVGNPGRVVKIHGKKLSPIKKVDQIHLPDPLEERLKKIESMIAKK